MQSNLFYVGYGSIEQLIEQGKPSLYQPVHVNAIAMMADGTSGIGYKRFWLLVSFIEAGVCHYCRVPYGDVQTMYGQALGLDDLIKSLAERGESATSLTKLWLEERGYRDLRDALVAAPRDLVLLDGDFGFLKWDKDLKKFRPVTEIERSIGLKPATTKRKAVRP